MCLDRARAGWMILVAVAAANAVTSYPANAESPRAGPAASPATAGRVYAETNGRANQILIFGRSAGGTLTREHVVSTGGAGGAAVSGCKGVEACPFLDSQGQLDLIAARHLLFAVNAGSGTVSSFRVTPQGLSLVDQKPSGGRIPNSLSSHGNLLYVLNTGSLNVAGFRFSSTGKLTPLRGSDRKLDSRARPGYARQLGFDNTGKLLAVTVLKPAEVETFPVRPSGGLSSPRKSRTNDTLPFAFVFDPANRMIVTQIHDFTGPHGSLSVYKLNRASAALQAIDRKPSRGFGPCWIALGAGGRFVYAVNTGAGDPTGATIVVFSLSSAGALTQLQVTPPLTDAAGRPEFERTNELLSSDGRYLYVLVHGRPGTVSHLDTYGVAGTGTLSLLGETPASLPAGISGLAGG